MLTCIGLYILYVSYLYGTMGKSRSQKRDGIKLLADVFQTKVPIVYNDLFLCK